MAPTEPTEQSKTTNLTQLTSDGARPKVRSWQNISRKGENYGRVAALLSAVLVAGGAVGYAVAIGLRVPTEPKQAATKVQSLSEEDIRKLSEVGSNLGTSDQTLTIGANTVFSGNINVGSDVTLGGKLNANGPVALSSLSLNGPASFNDVNVNRSLQVSGLANMQNGATINGLTAIAGSLSVSGRASVGSLTSDSVATRQLQLTGPISVGHIVSQGPPVTASTGSSIGAGGTVSVSGNDTSGTVTMNIGPGAGPGTLVTVAFRAAYGANVRVLLTPVSPSAATTSAYVTRTPNGFSINTAAVPSGGTLSFDYFVTQ